MTTGIRQVVIVGGGTAGWMTAAALGKLLNVEGGPQVQVQLVESDEIGTVGVGESTIPMVRLFNKLLGIDEDDFMRATQATFKLGIEFCDWAHIGDRYMHAFGSIGQQLAALPFHQYWLRMRQAGKAPELGRYSINRMAALAHKFMRADPAMGRSPLAEITHAFHLDAGLYARYLRRFAEGQGVRRTEGQVKQVLLHASGEKAGHVQAVKLASGECIEGDLFIDCTGFRGLLIEQALHTGFEDWSHWLPCDSAVVVPSARAAELPPFTRATARPAGWQWRIGLQHRTGNGHVYARAFMGDDEAQALLMRNLDAPALAEPRVLRFQAGRRHKVWNKNVVAVGLSSGFLEPLESTSIHLIHSTISRLIAFFPDAGFSPADIDEFNRQSAFEVERIRDFLVLHYHATERDDSDFWRYCRGMAIPDSLQQKIELYRSRGRIVRTDNELFAEVGWLQVFEGQRVHAQGHHPLAGLVSEEETAAYLDDMARLIDRCVDHMPAHADYIRSHGAAPEGMSIAAAEPA